MFRVVEVVCFLSAVQLMQQVIYKFGVVFKPLGVGRERRGVGFVDLQLLSP